MDDRLEIAANHPASRWEETRVLDFLDCGLTIEARMAGDSLIVLRSRDPLRVEQCEGARAVLRPGWDGTLGYSLYGLSVKFDEPGIATVTLARDLPPDEPQVTSAADIAAWRETFERRESRFPDDQSDFVTWQANYRLQLTRAITGGDWPQRTPPMAEVIKREERDGFALLHMRYWSTPQRQTTLLLSQPHDVPRAPLLVGVHGHEATWGGVEPAAFDVGHVDDFCAHFARAGWAVLQPATMDHELQNAAGTLHGEWTWDIMQAISVATDQPFVDADRVAVCGLSTGGSLAKTLLALDPRVKAGIVGCILSHWSHYDRFRVPPHCDCGLRSQIEPIFEQVDWLALAAPKPVQVQHGRQDAGFCPGADASLLNLEWNTATMPAAEFDALSAELARAWHNADASETPAIHIHDAGHRVDGDAALAFLNSYV
jgi:dienelactone hydrolase